jgi:hypothetical protein
MRTDKLCAMFITVGMLAVVISYGYAADKTTNQKTVSPKKAAAAENTKSAAGNNTVGTPAEVPAAGATAQPFVPVKATGTVTGCDLKKSRITVQVNPTVTLVFAVDKTTFLKSRGKNIKLSDINKGDPVVVGFAPGKGERTAIFVVVPAKPVMSAKPAVKNKK